MARGNDAVALLVSLATNGLSWLVTPFWLSSIGDMAGGQVETARLMGELSLVLVLPVAVGQAVRQHQGVARLTDRYKVALGRVCQLLVLSIVIKATVEAADRFYDSAASPASSGLLSALIAGLAVHLGAFACGLWTSRGLRLGRGNEIAVAFSCSQKTLPVALLLFDRHFKHSYPLALAPVVFYFVGQLLLDTLFAEHLNKVDRPKEESPASVDV